MKKLTLLLVLACIIQATATAQIINIPADYLTIQEGIDAASDGDTVLVDIGTYVENINFNGKNITVTSHFLITHDYSQISQTIIDGNQSGSVVTFENSENSSALLSGFTITNGSGSRKGSGETSQTHGGGIFLTNSSSPKLMNLIVKGNIAESANGAGICCWNNCHPLIENVIVSENDGTGNDITNDGSGGISLQNSNAILKNVLIINNEGLLAGGIYCASSNPLLINVTIANNIAHRSLVNNDSAEFISGGNSSPVILNTIIRNNNLKKIIVKDNEITIGHSNIQGGAVGIENHGTIHWLEGNIDQDPLFAGSGYYPYQINDYSPCIDAGTPDTTGLNLPEYDLAGEVRYYNDRIDMGAYEWNSNVGIEEALMPEKYLLQVKNYPNPFSTSTTIEYELKHTAHVQIFIYNYLGEQIKVIERKHSAGKHQIAWNAEGLPAGIYFCVLKTESGMQTMKMIKLK